MSALPALSDLSGKFYLPLSEGTARRLATNMLAGEHATEFTADDLLLDPAFVCWCLCHAKVPHQATLRSLAAWANDQNWVDRFNGDLKPLDPTRTADSERCRRLATRAYQKTLKLSGKRSGRGLHDSGVVVATLVQNAVKWFRVLNPGKRARGCPACLPDWETAPSKAKSTSKGAGKKRTAKLPPLSPAEVERIDEMWSDGNAWGPLVRQLAKSLAQAQRLEHRFEHTLNHEKLKAMRELAYGASHEINNPLANISTRAQMLMRDESDPDRKRSLAAIAHQAFRAHEMITDMMLFAKPPEVALRTTALGDVIRACRDELSEEHPVALTWQIDASCNKYEVWADRTALIVAIKAILQNSIEAIGKQGTIVIRAAEERQGGTVSVRISDSGPGIPEAIRRRVFDPFFSGREAGRGLGFGLPKAWQIIRQHGGQLTLEPSRKNRTEFVARLKSAPSA